MFILEIISLFLLSIFKQAKGLVSLPLSEGVFSFFGGGCVISCFFFALFKKRGGGCY